VSAIYVCPKSQLPNAVRVVRPSHLISLLDPADEMPTPDEVSNISRSTASALTIACMLDEPGREAAIARLLRTRVPHAQPNRLLVAHADELLRRDGRMVDAIDAMGPATIVFEGVLFALPVPLTSPG